MDDWAGAGQDSVLSATGEPVTTNTDLWKPYLMIAGLVAVLIFIFAVSKVPHYTTSRKPKSKPARAKLQ